MTKGNQIPIADLFNDATQALALAGITDISPAMLTAIAMVESTGIPGAARQEPAINDASYGLCQTLLKTAQWLYQDMGAVRLGEPTPMSLCEPGVSLYFGASYLHYLRNYRGPTQSDEFVVRAYNGGPRGISEAGTIAYYAKYQRALSALVSNVGA